MNMVKECYTELEEHGIIDIIRFNKNDDYKVVKAQFVTEEALNKLIKNGLSIWYNRFRVEKYIQPIKPIQCYNCQKFGHFSARCEYKIPTCAICSEKHGYKECKNKNQKTVVEARK